MHPCHVFWCHVWVLYHVHLFAFRWVLAVNHRPVPYLFCLPFPNRASDSSDLYIDFNRNHLTFPVALLVFQVEARFNHSFPNHAYASHTASRISYHDYACVFTMLFASFRVAFSFVPELWGFVRLLPLVFFMDSFFFLAGFQARWPLPWISLLSLLC